MWANRTLYPPPVRKQITAARNVALRFMRGVCSGNQRAVVDLFSPVAVVHPTVSNAAHTPAEVRGYFHKFMVPGRCGKYERVLTAPLSPGTVLITGLWTFWTRECFTHTSRATITRGGRSSPDVEERPFIPCDDDTTARFTMIVRKGKILYLHSSALPEPDRSPVSQTYRQPPRSRQQMMPPDQTVTMTERQRRRQQAQAQMSHEREQARRMAQAKARPRQQRRRGKQYRGDLSHIPGAPRRRR